MALTKAFAGYIRTEGGVVISGAWYQAYFHPNGTASSTARWNAIQQTDVTGYYSFNLGDNDFVTNDGTALNGSQVVVAAWVGDNARASLNKTAFAFIIVDVSSAPVYANDINALANRPPTTSFSVPVTYYRSVAMTITNNCTDGTTVGNNRQQRYYLSSNEIFGAVYVDSLTLLYGDGITGVVTGTNNGAHTYNTIGDYNVTGYATDAMGITGSTLVDSVRITYRPPVPGFTRSITNPTIQEIVNFYPNVTDVDTRNQGVDWSVDGVVISGGIGRIIQFDYQFPTNSPHTVIQTVYWNDGWVDRRTVTASANITMTNLVPDVSMVVTPSDVDAIRYTFISTANDPDGTIVNYNWLIERQGTGSWVTEVSTSGAIMQEYQHTFSVDGVYRVTLAVTDNNGASSLVSEMLSVSITHATVTRYGVSRARLVNEGGT